MKKLTCRELGGPCDQEIRGATFEEMGNNSRNHVIAEISKGDDAHRTAAEKMMNASPEQQTAWIAEFEKKYNEAQEV